MGNLNMPDSMVVFILDEKKHNKLPCNMVAIHMEFSGICLYIECQFDMMNSIFHGIFLHMSLIFDHYYMLSVSKYNYNSFSYIFSPF